MEQEIDPAEEYIRNFNLGYGINRDSPEIAELLDGLKPDGERWKAFKAGIDQYSKELHSSRTLSWLSRDRLEPPIDPSLDRESPDLELDRE
ncbi:hypothetical protein [Mucilaginibacter polytrichastri]|uniref:hypothetical protein n=1 Tax=Mucilaginibacter polytrichastri TaxID=1302689 RepID=UPI0008EF914B|nr:hypothetical protein [Mucilaginibacter polytrichastri]SFT08833.1 hypothetical protein SAMN04487890_11064 [Mucilaginibacter polytrichastri]